MTACIGWLNNGNAFIVADSAQTTLGTNATPRQTSVGEEQSYEDGVLDERAAKFVKIGEQTIGAIVGSVQDGMLALAKVKQALSRSSSIEDALQPFVSFTDDNIRRFQLLIAHNFNQRSSLWLIDPLGNRPVQQIYEDNKPVVLGSLPAEQTDMIKDIIVVMCNQPNLENDPDHMLSGALAVLQAMSQRSKFPLNNVGGLFFGAYVSNNGIHYQKDITHFIYSRREADINNINIDVVATACIRQGLWLAWSNLTKGEIKVFANDVDYLSNEQIEKIMSPVMQEKKGSYYSKSEFYTFIDKITGSVALVDCRIGADTGHWFTFADNQIKFSKALSQAIATFPDKNENQLPSEVPIMFLGNKDF